MGSKENDAVTVAKCLFTVVASTCVIVAFARSTSGDGIGQLPGYDGSDAPRTALVWASLADVTSTFGLGFKQGSIVDVHGDGVGDFADIASFDTRATPYQQIHGYYVSPTVEDSGYVLMHSSAMGFIRHGIYRIRRVENRWVIAGQASTPVPEELNAKGVTTLILRPFINDWMQLTALRQTPDGGDMILCTRLEVSQSGFTLRSRYAILLDGPDTDTLADTWSAIHEIPGVELLTIDGRGNGLGRLVRFQRPSGPFIKNRTEALVRVVDTNGDLVPDTIDETSNVTAFATRSTELAYGPCDIDMGTDRMLLGVGYPVLMNLDSRRRPIAGTDREAFRNPANTNGRFSMNQPLFMKDGSIADLSGEVRNFCGLNDRYGVDIWHDFDFDGVTDNLLAPDACEVREMVTQCDLPGTSPLGNHTVPELRKLSLAGEGTRVTFADFGAFPGDETFRFRFGSQDFSSVWVGRDGVVSFGAPVAGEASRAALERTAGVIAPCWSDEWDTSQLQLFAGYTPITRSFRTGERVLAFAVEWRGLRARGWEPERQISMRLLLYGDGTFRTDFGAFGSGEIGDMRIVVGYAGPGAATTTDAVDASAHSWGAAPAGTAGERVLAEEFGASNPSDLDHIFVRWNGYAERTDVPGPAPRIVAPALKGGKKVTLGAAGSEIAAGAVLVVDDAQVFALERNAKGSKWVVGARTVSAPGARTVRQVWSDGREHTIVVVNPDGQSSTASAL